MRKRKIVFDRSHVSGDAEWLMFDDSEEFLTGAQALFLFNSISESTDTGLY